MVSRVDHQQWAVKCLRQVESQGSSATASNDGGMVPNQLAVLVPTFDPSRDDVDTWAKKVELLMHAWPDGKDHRAGDEADTGDVRDQRFRNCSYISQSC